MHVYWWHIVCRILGAIAKTWKATISFVTSVCLSICSHGTTRLPLARKSWNLIFKDFSNICRGNSSCIKIWQNKQVLYIKTNILYIFIISRSILLRMKNVSHKGFRENRNTFYVHTLFLNRAVYEIMWERLYSRAGHRGCNTTHATAYWIPKATKAHSEYVILIVCPLQKWLHERV
jgi:hypothetical protein